MSWNLAQVNTIIYSCCSLEKKLDSSSPAMEKADLVFIPSPGIGHLVSSIEFANLLLERSEQLSITVLVMNAGRENKAKLASHTNIHFIELPYVTPPPIELMSKSVGKYISDSVDSNKTCVEEAIVKQVLPNSPKLLGLVIDFFCTSMIDVANELRVPSYLFFTSSAAYLAFMYYLPPWHDLEERELVRSESEPLVSGYINPVPAHVFPTFMFNKERYMPFLNLVKRFKEIKGILVNTFLELESHALNSVFNYHDLPSLYTVGPLINHKISQNSMQSENLGKYDEIMKWLDDQPPSSVVFLCFGSRGCFGVPQLKEIALGLERSEHRFLWSIRVTSEGKSIKSTENISPMTILPQGFLDRTKERGYICGWAPQLEVLEHTAVGGFVSHCGWNSILESLWFGVPILTWPLYAEQQLNAFQMVKDLGLAFELKLDSRLFSDDIVKGDEIAKALKCLMEEDSEVRKRVRDMSVKSRKALIAGGSSYASLEQWIVTMFANN